MCFLHDGPMRHAAKDISLYTRWSSLSSEMTHMRFSFHKHQHGKVHICVCRIRRRIPCEKAEKQVAGWGVNCEREYVSAPRLVFAKLQVDA